MKDENSEELYEFIVDYDERIYANEERREDSLIQQATHMQTVFSFMSAAVLMVAAIVVEYRANLSLEYLLVVFTTILATLLASLFCATKAQKRYRREVFQDAADFQKYVERGKYLLITKKQRYKYIADTYAKLHPSLSKVNDRRVEWIECSMKLFQTALALCVLAFAVSVVLLLKQ